jgi:DNA modification methylase
MQGLNACERAVSFLRDGGVTSVLDPFCGRGSILAVANSLGLDAIGIDLSTACVRRAKELRLVDGAFAAADAKKDKRRKKQNQEEEIVKIEAH